MKTIIANYNRCGYWIEKDGKVINKAGNHVANTQYHAPVGSNDALSLRAIREIAIDQAKILADLGKAKYGGVKRWPDNF